MEILKKIASQTSWQILGKIVSAGSMLLVMSLVARSYDQEVFGRITLALTFVGMLMLFLDFGVNGHLLRRIDSQSVPEQQSVLGKLLGIRITLSATLILIIILTFLLLEKKISYPHYYIEAVIASLIGSSVFTTTNLILQHRFKYKYSIVASGTGSVLFALLSFVFVNLKLDGGYILLAYSFGWIFIGAVSFVFLEKIIGKVRISVDYAFFKKIVIDMWPIGLTLILNTIYFRADTFMLAHFSSYSEVGIYNLAYQFFQTALVLPTFILNSYYPIMLKSDKEFSRVSLLLGLAALIGTAITFFVADWLIRVTAGLGYEDSAKVLKILSLGFFAFFLSSIFMWRLISRGLYKTVMSCYTLGLIFSFILNLIFIPKYTFFASSVITVMSEFFILVLLILFYLRGGKK